MEMVAKYIDKLTRDTIDCYGFSNAILTVGDRKLQLWVKDCQDDKNKSIAILASGFSNWDHYCHFDRQCVQQREPFEIFFRRGGFMYHYQNCSVRSFKPLKLKLSMDNEPLPFILRHFEFRKIEISYRR